MAARFTFPGKYAMRLNKKGKGKTRAYFTVVDNKLGVEFRDMRLIEGEDGFFVAAPFRTYEDGDGDTQYFDYFRAAYDTDNETKDENGMAWFEAICEAAEAKYNDVADDEEDERPRKKKKGKKVTKRAARDEEDEEEDEEEEEEKPRKKGKKAKKVEEDEDEDEEEAPRRAAKKSGRKSARKSGRGPLPKSKSSDEEDDDLPF